MLGNEHWPLSQQTLWLVTVGKAQALLITWHDSVSMKEWFFSLFYTCASSTLTCPNVFCKKGLLFATQLSSSLILILQYTSTHVTFSKTYLFSVWLCLFFFGWQCLSCVCHIKKKKRKEAQPKQCRLVLKGRYDRNLINLLSRCTSTHQHTITNWTWGWLQMVIWDVLHSPSRGFCGNRNLEQEIVFD